VPQCLRKDLEVGYLCREKYNYSCNKLTKKISFWYYGNCKWSPSSMVTAFLKNSKPTFVSLKKYITKILGIDNAELHQHAKL
jgi:hypothetical protein